MPWFRLYTNVPKNSLPAGFMDRTSKMISKAIGKPEIYITIRIHPDQMMYHGGSDAPCVNSELHSIGNLGLERNKEISKQISEFVKKELGIDKTRITIKFTDMQRMEVGYCGTTCASEELWDEISKKIKEMA